jgi:hypothetical protein
VTRLCHMPTLVDLFLATNVTNDHEPPNDKDKGMGRLGTVHGCAGAWSSGGVDSGASGGGKQQQS